MENGEWKIHLPFPSPIVIAQPPVRKALLALALLFLIAHAACLPTTFADIDAINFALGVRDFDVSQHQPHPPGYPVFIALAKMSTAVLAAIGVPHPDVRGLAALSAISGALLIPLLFLLFRALVIDRATAACAAAVTALSPLFWFNALRPLSDMTGLAAVVLAQALLASVVLRRDATELSRQLILGALVSGLAIGLRSQSFVLTLPLLGVALAVPRSGIDMRSRLLALIALAAGLLVWTVPLLVASGGPDAYLTALRNQAGEDFTGVVMLWTSRTARVAVNAIRYSFLWVWGTQAAGWIVVALAVAGAGHMALREPRVVGVLIVAFAPYAAFHLLFQETLTTRYALPLVIPVALLAVYALAGTSRTLLHIGSAALVAWSLAVAIPPGLLYGGRPTPADRALKDALTASAPDGVLAMHAVMLREEQLYHGNASGRVLRTRHGGEVPALVQRWLSDPDATVTFIADPRRSDLALLDRRSRTLRQEYGWGFPEMPLLGGVRPGEARVFTLRPPGWMLGPGWALTAEIGGQTERAAAAPQWQPAIAWVRSRPDSPMMMIGGRNLVERGGPAARITISSRGQTLDSWTAGPGFFFEKRRVPAEMLRGIDGYARFDVTAVGTGSGEIRVGLEQFDVQSDGVPMIGMVEGWQEPEYDPTSGTTWRWMSDRATLWVRSVGREVTLKLSAESPLRYYDAPPRIRFRAGGTVLAEITPSADFTHELKIPAAVLDAAGELIVIESDRSFVPGRGDQRKLALRVYQVVVD
jgi:hypothetical protein